MYRITLLEPIVHMYSPDLGGFVQVSTQTRHERCVLGALQRALEKNQRPFQFKVKDADYVLRKFKDFEDKNHLFPLGYHKMQTGWGPLYLIVMRG